MIVERGSVGVVMACLMAAGAAAHAASSSSDSSAAATVTLAFERCPSSFAPDVRHALHVEIGARLVGEDGAARATGAALRSRPLSRLVVTCDAGSAVVVVVAANSDSDRHVERTLAWRELPAATAPRIVALAGLELLATLDPELRRELSQEQARSQEQGLPQDAEPRVRSPTHDHLDLIATGVYRAFATSSGVRTWGAALAVRRSSGPHLTMAASAEVGAGRRDVDLGDMNALLASGSLAAGLRFGGETVAAVVELGVRGGAARLSGKSRSADVVGDTVLRPWAGPLLAAHALVGYRWLALDLGVEAGWALIGASGLVNDGPGVAARGPWLAVSFGAGFRR